jgi:hypothetical protein
MTWWMILIAHCRDPTGLEYPRSNVYLGYGMDASPDSSSGQGTTYGDSAGITPAQADHRTRIPLR